MKIKQVLAVLMVALLAIIARVHSVPLAIALGFVALATLAGTRSLRRGQLGAAPDTVDVAAELNLNEILDGAISAFRRVMLPLTAFATVFRNVQLQGTNKVEVPYFPLQGIASKDFTTGYDFTSGAGGKVDKREININKRKYQPLSLTSAEIARTPALNARKLGEMKGERLAYDVIQDVFSVVTAARFPGVAFTGAASGFDSDDVIDIRTSCNTNRTGPISVTDGVTTNGSKTITSATATFSDSDVGVPISGTGIPAGAYIANVSSATTASISANATADGTGVTFSLTRPVIAWPDQGRSLIVTPDYDGALLKDSSFKAAYAYGSDSAVKEGRLPRVFGFDYAASGAIPTNGENLVGMAAYMSAILFAQSPITPAPAVRAQLTDYEIVTDPLSEISIEYRTWGDADADTEKRVIEANYGFAAGESLALKRIKSA